MIDGLTSFHPITSGPPTMNGYHGYYSDLAFRMSGKVAIYVNPAGDEVACTAVGTKEYMDESYHWEDKKDLGPVLKWVRNEVRDSSAAGRFEDVFGLASLRTQAGLDRAIHCNQMAIVGVPIDRAIKSVLGDPRVN